MVKIADIIYNELMQNIINENNKMIKMMNKKI